jgi:glycosyltransferase involved in cell wall biosynthesis
VNGPLRVLVLIQGPLGDRLTGPEIRGWEIARAFAARHTVTAVASVQAEHRREGIRVVPRSRRRILSELRRHDVVVGPVIPPYALLAGRHCLRVADLYDPVDLELGTLSGRRARRAAAQQRAGRSLHLRWSDVVLSANERQMQRTRDDLAVAGRTGGAPALLTVPMGLPDPPPRAEGHPLRDRFEAIGADDPVVLWWGSVWRWLDAGTAVEAIGLLAARRPHVRLVITAGRPANAATDPLNVTEDVRALARERGLLDRHVFFLDDWVPFEERHRYLNDADVGITLHAATAEAALAARARYMDFVWAALPSVLAEGDEVADDLARAGAAQLVAPRDPAGAAAALESLLDDPARLAAGQDACRAVAESYRWETLLAPLIDHVEAIGRGASSPRRTLGVAGDATSYYARRVVDRCLTTLPE